MEYFLSTETQRVAGLVFIPCVVLVLGSAGFWVSGHFQTWTFISLLYDGFIKWNFFFKTLKVFVNPVTLFSKSLLSIIVFQKCNILRSPNY